MGRGHPKGRRRSLRCELCVVSLASRGRTGKVRIDMLGRPAVVPEDSSQWGVG